MSSESEVGNSLSPDCIGISRLILKPLSVEEKRGPGVRYRARVCVFRSLEKSVPVLMGWGKHARILKLTHTVPYLRDLPQSLHCGSSLALNRMNVTETYDNLPKRETTRYHARDTTRNIYLSRDPSATRRYGFTRCLRESFLQRRRFSTNMHD